MKHNRPELRDARVEEVSRDADGTVAYYGVRRGDDALVYCDPVEVGPFRVRLYIELRGDEVVNVYSNDPNVEYETRDESARNHFDPGSWIDRLRAEYPYDADPG